MTHGDVERERIVNRAIEARGHILVPSFAIGRTQTLLYHLNTLVVGITSSQGRRGKKGNY